MNLQEVGFVGMDWINLAQERDRWRILVNAVMIKSRRMRWAGHVARMGKRRGVYRVLVGKPEEKRLLRRPRCRREYNIKMDLQEVGFGDMSWINLTHDRDRWRLLVNVIMNIRVP